MSSSGPVVAPGSVIPARPLDVGEILDGLFRIYRSHFGLFISIGLIVAIPGLVLSIVIGGLAVSSSSLHVQPGQPPNFSRLAPFITAEVFSGLLALLVAPLTQATFIRAGVDIISGSPVSLGSALAGGLRRYFGMLGVLVIGFLLSLLILTCLLIPLVIWIAIRWAVAPAALIAERAGPIDALSRSWSLVQSRWWRTFGIVILIAFMSGLIGLVIGGVLGLVADLIPTGAAVHVVLSGVGNAIGNALVAPLTPIGFTLVYFDLRMRKEGADLQQLAQQAAPSGYPPSYPPAGGPPGGYPPSSYPPPPPPSG